MKRDYRAFIASLILFGSNGIVAAHIALESDQIVLLRTGIGSLLLVALVAASKRRHAGRACRSHDAPPLECLTDRRTLLYLVASGAAMGASWLFLYEAYRLVGVSMASLAYYCAPVLVMALSPILFKERLSAWKVAGFCAVLAGAMLINVQTLDGNGSTRGMLCGWMSALMHAAMVVFSKKADRVNGVESSLVQLVVSFALAAAFVALHGGLSFAVDPAAWPWIMVLGLLNTGTGCYLYFSSFGGLSAQTVSILGYLEPLSAVVLAAALLGETMGPAQIAGAALILGGALFSEVLPCRQLNLSNQQR